MNKNQIALSSLAMDLKRAALGYHQGSLNTGQRFLEEAMMRKNEIDPTAIKPYVAKLFKKLDDLVKEKDTSRIAEDALMYSTLFQNASLHVR